MSTGPTFNVNMEALKGLFRSVSNAEMEHQARKMQPQRSQPRVKAMQKDRNNSAVFVEEMVTDSAAIVVLHVKNDGFSMYTDDQFEGTARTHPDDLPGDAQIGRNLALSRAFKKAGRHYRKLAEEQLRNYVR